MQLDALERRQLMAGTPPHLSLIQRSVAEVSDDNNEYTGGYGSVKWAGINNATTTSVAADCTTMVFHLLNQAYKFTTSQWMQWTGYSGSPGFVPALTRWYNAAADKTTPNKGFEGFKNIANLEPGDLFISRYDYENASAYGHMTIVEKAPTLVATNTTTGVKAWNLQIIDCTGSVHTSDTRNRPSPQEDDTGVGRGTMRVYTDLDGNLQTWSWGAGAGWSIYDPVDRPCLFVKIPPVVAGTSFDHAAIGGPEVKVEFPTAVNPSTLVASDLVCTVKGQLGTVIPGSVALSGDGRTATFKLPANAPAGEYTFKINTNAVTDVEGNVLSAGATLNSADTFILRGDVNRDRVVNFSDLLIVAQNYDTYGRTFSAGNVDYDANGSVNFGDLLVIAQSYGFSVASQALSIASVDASTAAAKKRATTLVL